LTPGFSGSSSDCCQQIELSIIIIVIIIIIIIINTNNNNTATLDGIHIIRRLPTSFTDSTPLTCCTV